MMILSMVVMFELISQTIIPKNIEKKEKDSILDKISSNLISSFYQSKSSFQDFDNWVRSHCAGDELNEYSSCFRNSTKHLVGMEEE
jgi:hypothetical protein